LSVIKDASDVAELVRLAGYEKDPVDETAEYFALTAIADYERNLQAIKEYLWEGKMTDKQGVKYKDEQRKNLIQELNAIRDWQLEQANK
jgi:hypothetical protein